MPLLGLLLLFKNRKQLKNSAILAKYRILYIGLKQNYFYWEFVNIFRKVALLMINVFVEHPSIKIFISVGILGTIFFVQNRCKPYQERFFNALE